MNTKINTQNYHLAGHGLKEYKIITVCAHHYLSYNAN